MSIPRRTIGDVIDYTARFRNNLKELTNPSSVDVSIKYASGATAAPTAVNLSTGVYTIPVAVSEEGVHYGRVVGTGNGADQAKEFSFCGVPSSVV